MSDTIFSNEEHLIHGDQRERLKQAWLVHELRPEGSTTGEGRLRCDVSETGGKYNIDRIRSPKPLLQSHFTRCCGGLLSVLEAGGCCLRDFHLK